MFVNDYRPTKRIGIEELDGCINLFQQAIEAMNEDGVAGIEQYEGAWLALELLRNGKYEYPADFLAVFENKLEELYG